MKVMNETELFWEIKLVADDIFFASTSYDMT